MSGDSAQTSLSNLTQLLASVVGQLACPGCHAELRMDSSALLCTVCGRRYPILDGIPVLIAGEPAGNEFRA